MSTNDVQVPCNLFCILTALEWQFSSVSLDVIPIGMISIIGSTAYQISLLSLWWNISTEIAYPVSLGKLSTLK